MPQLIPEPLSRTAFAPYGEVMMLEGARHYPINQGTTERYHALACADTQSEGGQTILSVFRAQPRRLPLPVTIMERHPLGSQAFVPLSTDPEHAYLIVVAPAGEFEPQQMRAFIARGWQGVNYGKGVWHHPLIALHSVSDFLVMDRMGQGNNCEEVALDGSWVLQAR
ncbi:ureidoglycolate lyase [Undibacterium griseum]|uniref:Ureidoglycolate lyase n=1 Tax=Undibacterium griseum TaxID=2762295 RepID=A0ABR6YII2_9BURK|nr:ureidoglycolate lyase [Undibacterium griseum]MBC3883715.1 ureidoglycolate lyase [Undibacterium griseum]